MPSYLRPRRGKKTTAESENIVLKKGEAFFEYPDTGIGTGIGKIKMGDGVTSYNDLPYFLEIDNLEISNLLLDSIKEVTITGAATMPKISDYGKSLLAQEETQLTITFEAKSDVVTNIDCYPRNNQGALITGYTQTFSITTEWARYSVILTLPAGEYTQFTIRSNTSVSGGSSSAVVNVRNIIAVKNKSASKLAIAKSIDGVSFDGTVDIIHYGTCSTAAATAAKTVACPGFTLVTGATIRVKFTVTNTASSPTLNVNSTGAKSIMYRGSAITAGYLAANRVYEFIYDGTDYELVGDINVNTDTNVKQTSSSTSNYRALLMGTSHNADTSALGTEETGQAYKSTKVTACPSTGDLKAVTFTGDLIGTASLALGVGNNGDFDFGNLDA